MTSKFGFQVVLSAVDRASAVLQRVEKRVTKLGKRATEIGRGISTKVGAPLALFGALSLSSAADFESSMLRVQAITQKSGAALAGISEQAKELGANSQFTAGAVGGAQADLAQKGFRLNQIMAATPAVLDVAAAAQIELGEAAKITAGVMAAQGLDIERDFSRVADVLVTASNATSANLEELGESFKQTGPITKDFGVTLGETAALFGVLANNMIVGGDAGTTLRGGLSKLNKMTAETTEGLRRLGLRPSDLLDSNGQLKDLIEVLGILNRAGITGREGLLIFGKNAGSGMAALAAEGEEALRALAAQIDGGVGRAADVASVRMRGLHGVFNSVRSAFEAMQISIVQAGLGPWVEDLGTKLADLFRRVAGMSPATLAFASKVALLIVVLGPLLVGLGLVTGALVNVGLFVKAASLGLFGLGKVLLFTVVPAVWSFTTALLANPVGLVVALVAGLVAWLITLADGWGVVGDAVAKFGRLLGGFLLDQIKTVVGWMTGLLELLGLVGDSTAELEVTGAQLVGQDAPARPQSLEALRNVFAQERFEDRREIEVNFQNVPEGVEIEQRGGSSSSKGGFSLGVAMAGVGG